VDYNGNRNSLVIPLPFWNSVLTQVKQRQQSQAMLAAVVQSSDPLGAPANVLPRKGNTRPVVGEESVASPAACHSDGHAVLARQTHSPDHAAYQSMDPSSSSDDKPAISYPKSLRRRVTALAPNLPGFGILRSPKTVISCWSSMQSSGAAVPEALISAVYRRRI